VAELADASGLGSRIDGFAEFEHSHAVKISATFRSTPSWGILWLLVELVETGLLAERLRWRHAQSPELVCLKNHSSVPSYSEWLQIFAHQTGTRPT
jgi:hypothetical protein